MMMLGISDERLVMRRKTWANQIRVTRGIAMDWLNSVKDYPGDVPWERKCRAEHDRLMATARQYLKTSRDFAR